MSRWTNSTDHSLKLFKSEYAYLIEPNNFIDWTGPYFALVWDDQAMMDQWMEELRMDWYYGIRSS